jgi:hypothetical protein
VFGDSSRPSESSIVLLAHTRRRLRASSRNWLPVQSFWLAEVTSALVERSHFAVGHSLGYVVFPERAAPHTIRRTVHPLFEFRLPPEYCPTRPSPPAAAGRHLSWAFIPFSTCKDRRSTSHGLCLPATFRLQGLATLLAAYSRRARAGFVSHRRRSWDSPFGAFPSRKVPTRFRRGEPTYRFTRR